MLRNLSGIVLLGCTTATLAAQPPGLPTEPKDPDEATTDIVTIRGCVNGSILTATDLPTQTAVGVTTNAGDRFRVVGDRELMDLLGEHQGQEVNLIGRLVDPPDGPGERVRGGVERRIGSGTRIQVGIAGQPAEEPPLRPTDLGVDLAEIEVRGIQRVNPYCPAGRL